MTMTMFGAGVVAGDSLGCCVRGMFVSVALGESQDKELSNHLNGHWAHIF